MHLQYPHAVVKQGPEINRDHPTATKFESGLCLVAKATDV